MLQWPRKGSDGEMVRASVNEKGLQLIPNVKEDNEPNAKLII